MEIKDMFYLCDDSNGYQIWFHFKEKKLYATFAAVSQKEKASFYLVYPVALILSYGFKAFLPALRAWINDKSFLYRCLLSVIIIIVISVFTHILYLSCIVHSTQRYKATHKNPLRFWEIEEVTENEWDFYLQSAEKKLKKDIRIFSGLSAGMIVCIFLFLWKGWWIFWSIYFCMYLIAHSWLVWGRFIRRYQFINERRKTEY